MVLRLHSLFLSGFHFFSIMSLGLKFCIFYVADPVHTLTEPPGKDPSGKVLRSSGGFREAQGRIRGMVLLNFCLFLVYLFSM